MASKIEKVKVAINTPLPKAIIVVMTFCDKLAYNVITQPISNGLVAINPQIRDSSTPWEVGMLDHITSQVGD
jgi:hypothetical protein